MQHSKAGLEGIKEVEITFKHMETLGLSNHQVVFDPSLARGLSYYTGVIYEVKATSIQIGTITAGGRYDDLTGIFGLKGMSGVGISFGIDRIFDILEELDLYPESTAQSSKILITNFDLDTEATALAILGELRSHGIASEIYPDSAKLKKQMTYAHSKHIPFVLMVGSQEIEQNKFTLKDMSSGEQKDYSRGELAKALK